MIESLGNKIARSIWETGRAKGLPAELHERARMILHIMHHTMTLADFKTQGTPPELALHKLKGDLAGRWAVAILPKSGWRVHFEFADGKFIDVKIEDYH